MSIISALQTYLMGFDGMEMRTIHTDGTESEACTCAVAPAGNSKMVEDIIGNRTYINNYIFYAREYTTSEAERQENYDFLDAFFEWLEDNNDNEVFPEIQGYLVEEISAANAMFYSADEDGRGTYQIQIQLKLTKRRV
ncbi:MAG: hypothetical protein ACI4AO_04525 [Anaerotignum sp.]